MVLSLPLEAEEVPSLPSLQVEEAVPSLTMPKAEEVALHRSTDKLVSQNTYEIDIGPTHYTTAFSPFLAPAVVGGVGGAIHALLFRSCEDRVVGLCLVILLPFFALTAGGGGGAAANTRSLEMKIKKMRS